MRACSVRVVWGFVLILLHGCGNPFGNDGTTLDLRFPPKRDPGDRDPGPDPDVPGSSITLKGARIGARDVRAGGNLNSAILGTKKHHSRGADVSGDFYY